MTQPTTAETPVTQEGQDASQLDASQSEQEYIQLSRDAAELRRQLAELESNDPNFAPVFTEYIGRKAERKYTPRIKSLEKELEDTRRELRKTQIERMSADEIERKFVEDPVFAKEYAEIVHYKPEPAKDNEEELIVEAVTNIQEWAATQGIPTETLNQYLTKAMNGGYGGDEVHWTVSLQRLQNDLFGEVLKSKSPATPAPTTNSKLAKSGPDLSRGVQGDSSGVDFPKSLAEFKRLPWDTQRDLISTEAGKAELNKLMGKS